MKNPKKSKSKQINGLLFLALICQLIILPTFALASKNEEPKNQTHQNSKTTKTQENEKLSKSNKSNQENKSVSPKVNIDNAKKDAKNTKEAKDSKADLKSSKIDNKSDNKLDTKVEKNKTNTQSNLVNNNNKIKQSNLLNQNQNNRLSPTPKKNLASDVKTSNLDNRSSLSSAATNASAAHLSKTNLNSSKIQQKEASLVPRLTSPTDEGRCYLPHQNQSNWIRRDVTEGKEGVPLEVRLIVVDQTGEPFQNVAVDIWHADAQGAYSDCDVSLNKEQAHLVEKYEIIDLFTNNKSNQGNSNNNGNNSGNNHSNNQNNVSNSNASSGAVNHVGNNHANQSNNQSNNQTQLAVNSQNQAESAKAHALRSFSSTGIVTSKDSFLRGRQITDRNGVVTFKTIYPGWHFGRTTHIYFKVWNNNQDIFTAQIFFPDALSEYIYQHHAAYSRPVLRDTSNQNDLILQKVGNSLLGSVREERNQYVVTLAIAVDRSGRSVNHQAVAASESARLREPLPEGSDRMKSLLPKQR